LGLFYSPNNKGDISMKKSICLIIYFCFLTIANCAMSGTEEDSIKTYSTSDVVVTATRISQSSFNVGRCISIINKDKLQLSPLSSLGDVLSKNGVGFVAGSALNPGMQQSLFLRGAHSNESN
jgi:outer membrane cobalamin receptor